MTSLLRHFSAVVVCAAVSTAACAVELAKYPKALKGPDGVSVLLAASANGEQALVQVTGINHAIDQVVFLATREAQGASRDVYFTTIDGRRHNLLYRNASSYGGGDSYTTYLPNLRDGIQLGYSEKESQAVKLGALKTRYEQQLKDGVQDRLARFDRDAAMARAQAMVEEADQGASMACDTPIKTTLRWTSMDDGQLQTLSIGSFCSAVAREMASLCGSQPAFKSKAQALGQVQCQFGSALKLRLEDRQVVFTTEAKAPNQDEFVRQFLRNQ